MDRWGGSEIHVVLVSVCVCLVMPVNKTLSPSRVRRYFPFWINHVRVMNEVSNLFVQVSCPRMKSGEMSS